MTSNISSHSHRADRLRAADCDIEEFRALVSESTQLADHPHASDVVQNVLVYDGPELARRATDDQVRADIQDELANALLNGPGIVVFRGAFTADHAVAETTRTYRDVIRGQRESGVSNGDHFAKPGANDRIWSALQKLAVAEPEQFARYYANDLLALVAEAWLGPMYQVTSAINVVNPGGAAQNPHRDYHLGFMSTDTAAAFRAHIHRLSPALTLQGAVAHCDMPIESGPTMYLPHSQKFEAGYIAFNLPEFREYFADNHVQLPLREGDAVFFNPALFHAAGHNTSTDIFRMANLLQISSPFGRALDSVDRQTIVSALYPTLVDWAAEGRERDVANVIAASAEGYAFPSNLDLDQPISGLAGETHAELVRRALASGLDAAEFDAAAADLFARHRA
ncbi:MULTISPECIES: phytanoyl-CoA dioxygenase family protein [unclassified Rhodococcus (in: high G+C Gram-positive bacteria)]|uniref:phytanoyl-CoA dioxygenase family protein n=1 Tax=unclassified Rhodococcus (in: high G+C Gram-positive bacteria) TaxID=192944 RepID=UPI001C9A8D5E|nr:MULTISPECIES: phytanoyl-CoA dioxygenase family protein [unclassified Rhodococcus (in: high G+C Gram-positive bacteria)]MBY6681421.1 phytanoyl-CoA dioxygenase family protein [Rhodococcus sp. BP-316]MDQ1179542.1 ectoine hydroxylase-related dioxygenase (phytanoyl-CoA dioxygenase family) [Rhodococcus sp. SORGH_AS_0301]